MRRITTVIAWCLSIWAMASNVDAAELTCPSATSLDALASCIRSQMPASGSNGYVAPTLAQQSDWRTVVRQMLEGTCSGTLPAGLVGIMQRRTFTDNANGRSYCLLIEVLDANNNGKVDRGWGTFVVYNDASRELSHQAPHPIYDSTTENQAIGIFRDTDSRSYLMAGAHRLANSGSSGCQSSYGPADAAHNVDNMFQATNAELIAYYGANDWWAIQWHGMSADTCLDAEVYLSHGRNAVPAASDKILELRNNMLLDHPTWDLETPGTGACSQTGTDNTQGRLINGVAASQVCGTAASSYTGRFLHIEQDPGFRSASDWVQAVIDTWPEALPDPPGAPANLTATAGNAQVTLTWSTTAGADTYRAHRSTTSGGPYGTIASNLATPSYLDTSVSNGTTYYYVVSAVNEGGEGPDSSQVSATPQAPQVPAAPTGVTAAAGKKKATLSWTAVSGATGYRVKRSTTNGGPYTIVASNVTTSTFTNTGLKSGVSYFYVVSAVNAIGEGVNSAQVSVRPN